MKKAKRSFKVLFSLAMLIAFAAMPAVAQEPQSTPPPPSAPRSVQLPKPVERTLANGLRVIVVERPGTPLVAAQLLVKNGAEVDPPELSGLANMVAGLLTKGTAKRSATQIAEEVEALGASLESFARWDASRVNLDAMSSKVAPALEIMADVVKRPAFNNEEIDRLKQQTLDDLTVELGDPGTIAAYVGSRVVFGDTPYGQPLNGTPQSIPRITREDLLKYHSRYYRPDNAVLIFGGDIKAAQAFTLAQKLFGDWNKPAAPLAPVAAPKDRKSTRLNSSHSQISYAVFCLKKKKLQGGRRMCGG